MNPKSHYEAALAHAKRVEWERTQPPGPLVHLRRVHVMRGDGGGTTIYLGQHRGAGYFGIDLRGFNGWSSSRWMPGGWEFFNPRVSVGRLMVDRSSRSWSCEVLIPAKVWNLYYWRVRPSGRRFMREHGHDEPIQEAP